MSGGINNIRGIHRDERTKRLVALCGLTLLLSALIVMLTIFMAAYSSPTKTAIIHVNTFNEAPLELALLLSTSVLGFYAFALLFRDFRQLRRYS